MEVEGRTRERDVEAPETRPERPPTPDERPEAQHPQPPEGQDAKPPGGQDAQPPEGEEGQRPPNRDAESSLGSVEQPFDGPARSHLHEDVVAGGNEREQPDPDARVIDAAADRPGIPMEAEPGPPVALQEAPVAAADAPSPPQPGAERHLRRAALEGPTPVIGTAQPPHGLSGFIRRKAYEVPERFARHWMLLLVADRVDVAEDRVGSALAGPLDSLGMPGQAGHARRNPFGVLAWFAASVWLTKRLVSGRRG